jgi:thioredoxin-like negative regulator of GroEL
VIVMARRRGLVLLLAALIGGLSYGCWRLVRAWRYRAALVEIREEIEAGRHGTAARYLAALLAGEPSSDEVVYLLGLCEKARGRSEAAAEAWARIPPDSRFAAPALEGQATALVDQGRFANAERLLSQAMEDPRIDGFDLRRFLAPLYWNQGRIQDALRLIEANWEGLNRQGLGGSDRAVELARLHIAVSSGTSSIEAVRTFLDRAERLAPRDDRIWLGKANLAIRRGAFDEAARRLDDCLRRHPEDVAVWRARLDWALTTGRVAEVREALQHLPAAEATPAQVHRLAAWLAARRGDAATERRAWERLIAVDPGDGTALDRLAELMLRESQAARATEFRSRKAAVDRLQSRYRELFLRNQSVRDAAEMARVAEQLGRLFEAKAFASLAVATGMGRDDLPVGLARLEHRGTTVAEPGRTLADVLASELDAGADPVPVPPPYHRDMGAAGKTRP